MLWCNFRVIEILAINSKIVKNWEIIPTWKFAKRVFVFILLYFHFPLEDSSESYMKSFQNLSRNPRIKLPAFKINILT